MGLGDVTASEGRVFQDPQTGASIRQITNWRTHSHHMYFTNSGLWDKGRRLLISSHRNNAPNIYSVELASGELTQLTDFPPGAGPHPALQFLNPVRDEAYFGLASETRALNLRTFEQRTLFQRPEGYRGGNLSCTADGKTLCHVVMEDLSGRMHLDLSHGYVGMEAHWRAQPHCLIYAIDTDGGGGEMIHEEKSWLGHINTSPTMANLLTFCHEGPWKLVDQRMWMLDLNTRKVEALRKEKPGEAVGHEYWYGDGERIGYHGKRPDRTEFYGHIRWDNSGNREFDFPYGSYHFHSIDETLIVGDGMPDTPYLLLWKLKGDTYDGPRRLLTHRGSFHSQFVHPHPRMFADLDGATRVVYTADPQGYANVYIADVGDFDALPIQQ